MKTKNIFKTLAMAMLLPAMLLTTACSNSDDDAVVNNNEQTAKKGYPLQVTVNVTREGDEAATRASYNESTKKLSFSAGDQLFVAGYASGAGEFAGTLTWVSEGTFSGTITTSKAYSGTAAALFSSADDIDAELLPAGYGTYGYFSITANDGYDAALSHDGTKTFATTKAAAVEQFSREYADSYSGGFTLSPANAILYFTISGLTASTNVTATLTNSYSEVISGTVITNGSGVATFAMAVGDGTNLNELSLTVGGKAIALGIHALAAGKIYNVTRAVGALAGKFSVSSTKQVYFSKGNLQYQASTGTWRFAEHQYDFIGGGNFLSESNTDWIDLYRWGTSGIDYTGHATLYRPWEWAYYSQYFNPYGSLTTNLYDGAGENAGKADWGYNAISNGGNTQNSGWRTLKNNTTDNEWQYIFNTRTTANEINSTSNARYTQARINTDDWAVKGIILFPDGSIGDTPSGVTWGDRKSVV